MKREVERSIFLSTILDLDDGADEFSCTNISKFQSYSKATMAIFLRWALDKRLSQTPVMEILDAFSTATRLIIKQKSHVQRPFMPVLINFQTLNLTKYNAFVLSRPYCEEFSQREEKENQNKVIVVARFYCTMRDCSYL